MKSIKCCGQRCISKMNSAFNEARKKFVEKDLKEQADWILAYLADHHIQENGKFVYQFFLGISTVCRTAWMHVNGVTRSRFYELKKAFEAGRILTMPRNFNKKASHSQNVNKAMTWLCHFSKEFGDKMPDSKYTNLPSSLTRNEVYERMKSELTEDGDEPCSRIAFFRTWKKEFRHIVIPKQNRFSKCNSCIKYKLKLERIQDKELRKKVQTKRDNHIKFQNSERRKYYKHILKAKRHPERYMSMIIDGMDQKTTSLPKPRLLSKCTSAMWRLSCHLVAVIVHGRSHHVYVDVGEVPQDSNSTCNILLQTLQKHVGNLPPVLYLQMDNTVRENKNQFVFALMCVLIELKVFQKIKVSFLPVGHTHEDVDQYFSRISIHLAKFAVATFRRLLELIPSATPKIKSTAERLKNVFNFKEWFIPCLAPMSNHSFPHVFRFTRDNATGKAVIFTRNWASTGETWKPCVSGETDNYLLRCHPDGLPNPVLSDVVPLKLDRLIRDIKSAVKKQLMTKDSLIEWEHFVKQLREEEVVDDIGTFPLYDLLPYDETQTSNQHQDRNSPAADNESTSSVSEPSCQVHLGRKKSKPISRKVEEGDMVCVYDRKFPTEWPQVGQVIDLTDTSLIVKWFGQDKEGGPYNIMYKEKGKKRVAYTTTMPLSCVISEPFKLNKNRRIPKKIQDTLDSKLYDYFSDDLAQ